METRNEHPGIQPAEDMHGHPTTVRGEPVDGLPLRGPNDEEEQVHAADDPARSHELPEAAPSGG
ncbi:hypothetical protein FGE12_06315 [Aggregicoccus sp. 17bor-14]|uniref:hypothetical protein n=1 Tax=Myxococcaceae TaxID=31 RepID=UPI00129CD989|nr:MULTISPECIES: hypothetical protein [Myxococcaceae]MBF5042001.1 hypothetical protein [Simulacricoccus sp. 17bor-14]MRI87781.1 hypothetical protein [Aggregicoccus sp. 17bor-14]